MTRFSNVWNRTAAKSFGRQFGESIGYTNRAGDPVRTITARVIRDPMTIMAEAGDVPVHAMIISVENDSTAGITSDEINTGGDYVSVAPRAGGTAEDRTIVQVLPTSTATNTRFVVE